MRYFSNISKYSTFKTPRFRTGRLGSLRIDRFETMLVEFECLMRNSVRIDFSEQLVSPLKSDCLLRKWFI